VSQKSKFTVFCWTTNVKKGEINKAVHNSKLQIKPQYHANLQNQICPISKLIFCCISDTPLMQCLHNIDLGEILRLPAIGLQQHRWIRVNVYEALWITSPFRWPDKV
jgi:hypothetical protein